MKKRMVHPPIVIPHSSPPPPLKMPTNFPQPPTKPHHSPTAPRRQIRSHLRHRRALPADLHHPHHFSLAQYRRADDFLYRFPRGRRRLHAFEHRRVPDRREVIVDLRPVLPRRPCCQRRGARQRHKSHVLQRLRHQKVEMPPPRRHAHDPHFVRLHS